MIITYSAHAEQKLSIRRIDRRNVEKIITGPNELFQDTEHHANVAVGAVDDRYLVAVYRKVDDDIKVIAVYYTRKVDKLVTSKMQRDARRRVQ